MGINEIKKEHAKDNKKLILSVIKITLLIVIIVAVPLYVYFFQRDWLMEFRNFDDVVAYLQKYEKQSIIIYIGFQIIQIVISVIPGQVFQLAAGYMFSFWPALFYALLGAGIGTVISFFLARLLGRDFVHIFFGEEKMNYYIERLNSKKAYTIVFFLYLIPGLPKDVVSYAAGASDMDYRVFLPLSLIGRLPGMIGSILIGSMWYKGNYTGMIIMGIIAVGAFVACVICRKRINAYLDKIYEKIKMTNI